MSKLYRKDPKDRRGKWTDVFKTLFILVVGFMAFRWVMWEPYVIPSGSMKQTLLVQDYVLVNKWVYGLRLPFTESWLVGPHAPQRGDIVVFKSVDEDTGHILVKRVVGLPGDQILINEKGFIQINDTPFVYQEVDGDHDGFVIYEEDNGKRRYRVQFAADIEQTRHSIEVPPGHLFMMGDNRNYSADSRFWGPLPLERIVGKLVMVWISCEESDSYSSFICNAKDLRLDRLFKTFD